MTIQQANAILIELLPLEARDDTPLIHKLTDFINDIYEEAEAGIFNDRHTRTTEAEIISLIESHHLVVATTVPYQSGNDPSTVKGCIKVAMLSPTKGTLGMLCADRESRQFGIGKKLVLFAENRCRRQGATLMQLELVIPTEYVLPLKVWIQQWYIRLGYEAIGDEDFKLAIPQLAANLITPVIFRIFQKSL